MWTQQAVGGLPSEDQHCDVDTAGCLGDYQVRINTDTDVGGHSRLLGAVGGLPSEDQHCDVDTAGCWGITK